MADSPDSASQSTPKKPRQVIDPGEVRRTVKWLMRQKRLHQFILKGVRRKRAQAMAQFDYEERTAQKLADTFNRRIGLEAHHHPDACAMLGVFPIYGGEGDDLFGYGVDMDDNPGW